MGSLNTLPTSNYQINFPSSSNKQITVSFGPSDVHVFKFISDPATIPNYNNGWQNVWTNFGSGKIDACNVKFSDKIFAGDFDGDGSQELLNIQSTNTNAFATLLKYQSNDWDWLWSNNGNGWLNNTPLIGWGIKANDKYYVGNFDGITGDELLCVADPGNGTYITVLKFQSGNWTWLWSNMGSTSGAIYPYRLNLTVGDYDGDHSAELLGVDGTTGVMKMFDFNSVSGGYDWVPKTWTSSGTSDMMYPYRNNFKAGDFNGDGTTDILGISNACATVFYFNGTGWTWGENNNCVSSTTMAGWAMPPASTDVCLVGNIDIYDAKDEIFWIQNQASSGWATSMNTNWPSFSAGWTNSNSPAYIDDWAVTTPAGVNTKYLLVKPTMRGGKKYLLAMRDGGCSNLLVSMYDANNGNNYRAAKPKNEEDALISNEAENISIYPNPTNGIVSIVSNEIGINELELFNSYGQLILKNRYNSERYVQLDINKEINGVYFLKVTNSKNVQVTKKIVLNK